LRGSLFIDFRKISTDGLLKVRRFDARQNANHRLHADFVRKSLTRLAWILRASSGVWGIEAHVGVRSGGAAASKQLKWRYSC
jgi:hypothetical protein